MNDIDKLKGTYSREEDDIAFRLKHSDDELNEMKFASILAALYRLNWGPATPMIQVWEKDEGFDKIINLAERICYNMGFKLRLTARDVLEVEWPDNLEGYDEMLKDEHSIDEER